MKVYDIRGYGQPCERSAPRQGGRNITLNRGREPIGNATGAYNTCIVILFQYSRI